MIDLFPYLYRTAKAHTFFVTTKEGFLDEGERFKFYKRNEAPNADKPFITVEIQPGGRDQNSGWVRPFVLFHVWGDETMWEELYEIAEALRDMFQGMNELEGDGDPLVYQTVGPAEFDEGENPVVDQVVVSVGMRFAFDA